MLYNEFLRDISDEFSAAWTRIKVNYNYDLGVETEIALCKLLQQFLPSKFGICRGFVVSSDGQQAGDDVIIYDRLRFPTIRNFDGDPAKKDQVPIEAVYAYIEVKSTLNILGDDENSIQHAVKQAAKVKELCETRKPVPLTQITTNLDAPNMKVSAPEGFPDRRNPMYSMVFGRRVREKKGKPEITDSKQIAEALLRCDLGGGTKPDFVAVGDSNVCIPGTQRNGKTVLLSPFNHGTDVRLFGRTTPNLAFGVFVAHLFWALDFIELHKMSWADILSDGLGYKNIERLSQKSKN